MQKQFLRIGCEGVGPVDSRRDKSSAMHFARVRKGCCHRKSRWTGYFSDNKYLRSDAFQIISAGKNKIPGAGGQFTPGIGTYSPSGEGGDDISNFHKGQLGGDE